MSNFKFFLKNQSHQEDKVIIVEFELIVQASHLFEVPFDYDINGMNAEEAYEQLINDFPDQNNSIIEDPVDGIDHFHDVDLSYIGDFTEHYKDENGRNVSRILDV